MRKTQKGIIQMETLISSYIHKPIETTTQKIKQESMHCHLILKVKLEVQGYN